MINILEEFEKFLNTWCKEQHFPRPKGDKRNKIWYKGWQAFMDTYLKEHYDEIREQFMNIKLVGDKNKVENVSEDLINSENLEKNETSWDRINRILNES